MGHLEQKKVLSTIFNQNQLHAFAAESAGAAVAFLAGAPAAALAGRRRTPVPSHASGIGGSIVIV